MWMNESARWDSSNSGYPWLILCQCSSFSLYFIAFDFDWIQFQCSKILKGSRVLHTVWRDQQLIEAYTFYFNPARIEKPKRQNPPNLHPYFLEKHCLFFYWKKIVQAKNPNLSFRDWQCDTGCTSPNSIKYVVLFCAAAGRLEHRQNQLSFEKCHTVTHYDNIHPCGVLFHFLKCNEGSQHTPALIISRPVTGTITKKQPTIPIHIRINMHKDTLKILNLFHCVNGSNQ